MFGTNAALAAPKTSGLLCSSSITNPGCSFFLSALVRGGPSSPSSFVSQFSPHISSQGRIQGSSFHSAASSFFSFPSPPKIIISLGHGTKCFPHIQIHETLLFRKSVVTSKEYTEPICRNVC